MLTSAEQLAPYIKTMMPVPDSEHAPSAALMATTVEQIQKIVGICNQYKVPVWPSQPERIWAMDPRRRPNAARSYSISSA